MQSSQHTFKRKRKQSKHHEARSLILKFARTVVSLNIEHLESLKLVNYSVMWTQVIFFSSRLNLQWRDTWLVPVSKVGHVSVNRDRFVLRHVCVCLSANGSRSSLYSGRTGTRLNMGRPQPRWQEVCDIARSALGSRATSIKGRNARTIGTIIKEAIDAARAFVNAGDNSASQPRAE